LIGRIARLEEELSSRVRQVHQLSHTVKDLNKQLEEARQQKRLSREAHLAHVLKNSQNSSLPPSTDRRKRTRSLRDKSGRKPGGQVGHRGATREFVKKPDHLVIHSPESCDLCGSSLNGAEVKGRERRQVHDLPPQKIEVIEHQAQTKVCVRCGMKNKAEFPSGINAPVQYGKGIRSVVAYLLGYHLLPYERCAETMKDLFNSHLSAGTLATIFKECAREMVEPLLLIKEELKKSEVLGVDETNLRVKKKQEWVHVSSTEKLTLLVHDKRRGTAAIENIGILPGYKGVAVHDGFSDYDRYGQCRHSLCNAHILRELNYVIETSKPTWATEMKQLLLEIKAAVSVASESGKTRLVLRQEKEFLGRYNRIVAEAGKLYEPLRRKKYRAKIRRPRESPIVAAARKLVNRLAAKRDEILLFMTDFKVPFDRYERGSQRQNSPVPPNSAFGFDGPSSSRRMA
jgi:transposase